MACDLILVGASVRAAAQSALLAGFRPYAIDQFADSDLRAVCPTVKIERYPFDFLAALRDAPGAPWIYTGGLENHPRLVDRMAIVRPLWGNPRSVLQRVRDPWQLAEAAREAGLAMPAMARELVAGAVGPWLIKPLRSSGGYRIARAGRAPQPAGRGYYYQQFIPGDAHGAVYLASHGRCQLLGVSRHIPAAENFAYHGSIVAPGLSLADIPALVRLGEVLADRFELRGLFNVDFVASQTGLHPLEVNPRYSASVELLERTTGVGFLAWHAAAFGTGALPDPSIQAPACACGKAVVYAPTAGVVTAAMEELTARWNSSARWPTMADIPPVGASIAAGQPICTVFAEAESVADVERLLQERSQHVLAAACQPEASASDAVRALPR